MSIYRRIIRSDYPVSLKHTVFSHGWVNLAPYSFDERRESLSYTERQEDHLVRVSITQLSKVEFRITVCNASLMKSEIVEIVKRVIRRLSLDWDPRPAIKIASQLSPPIARLLRLGAGRFLRGGTFYEDFVKTLTTINASWSFTQKMVRSLVNDFGEGAFPQPKHIMKSSVLRLQEIAKMGYRAKVLYEATCHLLQQNLIDDKGVANDQKITFDDLISIKGIGQYAATHMTVLLHSFSKIPIDSEVSSYCAERYGINKKGVLDFFSPWKDFTFLGYKLTRMKEKDNWIG